MSESRVLMSEPRVLPTEPGVYYVECGDDGDTLARISFRGDYDAVARFFNGADVSVKNRKLSILAPVPSREAVQAAVEAMRRCFEICQMTANFQTVAELKDAIAGLTGKGV